MSTQRVVRLDALIALQELDARIHTLRVQRDACPRTLAAGEAKVAAAKTALDDFRKGLKKHRIESDKKELDLKSLEAKVKQLEGQLNQCSTNKEYAILKKEIDGLLADKSVLDDEILQLFSAFEEKEKESAPLDAAVKAAETELKETKGKIDEAIAAIEKDLAELEKQRAGHCAEVDAEVMKTYHRVLEAKEDGLAIVPVVDGCCQGCYMDITSQEINLLLMNRHVLTCKNCSRILYIPKEAAAAAGGKKKG